MTTTREGTGSGISAAVVAQDVRHLPGERLGGGQDLLDRPQADQLRGKPGEPEVGAGDLARDRPDRVGIPTRLLEV